jgi:hypothetical protein
MDLFDLDAYLVKFQAQGGVEEPFAVASRQRNNERGTETADETGF